MFQHGYLLHAISARLCMSRKENPQKLTQLTSRSHPRHLVGKRTAQKDTIIDITRDSQVNSNFPNRWSPASLTFNNYFYLFLYLYIMWITINNNAPHLKSPKNQNRRAALGRPAIKITGGASTSLRSTNPRPRPYNCFVTTALGDQVGWWSWVIFSPSVSYWQWAILYYSHQSWFTFVIIILSLIDKNAWYRLKFHLKGLLNTTNQILQLHVLVFKKQDKCWFRSASFFSEAAVEQ